MKCINIYSGCRKRNGIRNEEQFYYLPKKLNNLEK